uniref:hypothetical protein n=1 Tax=Gordonia sp. B7-2 TaxID=3420932 RepID=UPI003D9045DA
MMSDTSRTRTAERLTPERLTPDDDLFVRMEHALRLPVVNQCVWRLDGNVTDAAIAEIAARLRRGRLSRLVHRRRTPGRDRWVHTPAAGRFSLSDRPIAAGEEASWARRCVDAPLDTIRGPSWRLTAARSADGSAVFVSLVASHVVGDGGAVMTAVTEAVADIAFDATDTPPRLRDNLRDTATLLGTAGRAAAAMVTDRRPTTQPRRDSHPETPAATTAVTAGENAPVSAPTTILTIRSDAFRSAASASGGTPNSLFVAIMVGALERTGRIHPGEAIGLSLPMSTRTDNDRRANATTGVTAAIVVDDDRYRDLGAIRTACKSAFRTLVDGPSPAARLGIVAQALGDRAVRRLAANVSAPLCLASNLGELDPRFASLGTGSVGPVAMRSVASTPDLEVLRSMAGGISGWASESGGLVTLCVTSLDPDRVADDQALSKVVADELGRWSLTGSAWGT